MNIALITGATSGIGLEITKELLRDNIGVVLVGRNQNKLDNTKQNLIKKFKKAWIETICQELVVDSAAKNILKQVTNLQKKHSNSLEIQYLINNAGFGDFGEFNEMNEEKLHEMLMLNMVTLTELTRAVLPMMKKQNHGRILNVASTAAFLPGPLMTVYYATKAYVLSFSEGLAEELRDSPISVSVLCPGPTKTEFQKTADLQGSRLFKVSTIMSAEEVAGIGYEQMKNKKRIIIPGFSNKMTSIIPRFLPRSIVPWIVKKVQEKG